MDRHLSDHERFSRHEARVTAPTPEPGLASTAEERSPADDGFSAFAKIAMFTLVGLFGYFLLSSIPVPGRVKEAFNQGRAMQTSPSSSPYSLNSRDIAEVARALAGSDASKTKASLVQGRVNVTIDLEPIGFVWVTRQSFWGHVQKMVPEIFARFPEAQVVRVTGEAMLRDIRGNDTRGAAVWLEFSRQDAARVNWQNVLRENLPAVATAQWSVQAFK